MGMRLLGNGSPWSDLSPAAVFGLPGAVRRLAVVIGVLTFFEIDLFARSWRRVHRRALFLVGSSS
jgi:hypothetical protein